MKHYDGKDPARLYVDCRDYVLRCVMIRCYPIRREEAEDCVSDAFAELLKNEAQNLTNWVWLSVRRGFSFFQRYRNRFENVKQLPDIKTYFIEYVETYRPIECIRRKKTKEVVSLAFSDYDYEDIAQKTGKTRKAVVNIMHRARITIEKDLENDVKKYHGNDRHRTASFHQLRFGHDPKRIEIRKQQAIRRNESKMYQNRPL